MSRTVNNLNNANNSNITSTQTERNAVSKNKKTKQAIKVIKKWSNYLLQTNLMDFKEDRTELIEAIKIIKKN